MNINVNALKEAFYKQLYIDYKYFLSIHMGAKKDPNYSNKMKPYDDIYSKVLNVYKAFDPKKNNNDLGELSKWLLQDEARICCSVEDFFDIIKDASNELDYVASLMQYIKDATTKEIGSWLQIEDNINMLILKHFWRQRCEDGSLTEDHPLSFKVSDSKSNTSTDMAISFCELCAKPSLVTEQNIIDLMGELPGCDTSNKEFFIRHLHKSRIIRNNFTHKNDKDTILPDNFADAVILARYKLYCYIASVLCLRRNEPQMEVQLPIEDCTENHNAKIRVFEVKKKNNGEYELICEIPESKHDSLGFEFTLKRCHTYRIEVSSLEEILNLGWYSLNPSGTWDGIKLTIYDNDFEKVALNPSGTLSSILDTNKQIAETLAHIDKALSEILDNKDQKKDQKKEDINKIILVLENLQKLQQDNYESSQARFEALLEANKKQGEELVEVNSLLGKVNVTLETQATKLTTIAELVAESINNDKKTNQNFAKIIETLLEEFAQTREAYLLILKQIRENQEQKRRNDETWFFIKRLPIWLALGAAAIGCVLHCIYTQSLNWVLYKPFYIGVLLIGPLVLAGGLLIAYHTTRRKELITNRVKRNDWGAIGLATLFWGIAIAVTPHSTEEELIQRFSWTNEDHVCQSFIEFANDYLAKYPESEKARIKLGDYYLNIANDLQKALEVTAPMRDVEKYPIGCVYAAEAYYQCDSLLRVKDIIDKYKRYFPKTRMNGIERLYALLLIEGQGKVYDKADPDQGLIILYRLAETGYLQACYDLGHWSATDLAEWKPGTEDVASLRYDLPTAVKYLRRVSDNMPKAALELGNLYADLGVVDSAKHYIDLAIKQAKGELYSEALYSMGLLLERQGQPENSYMEKAQDRDYTPAIEHKALLEKDHKTAIERMKLAGLYKGSRTIPPIVFEYLKATESRDFTGLADSALKVLQNQKPECKFNRTFVNAMEAIIGTSRMKKDLDSAMVLLRQSAEEGCLYAKMMCCYQDAIIDAKNGHRWINLAPLNDIAPIIPFAGVLLSDLLIKAGYYGEAIKAAQYPIAKNVPAAAFILSSIPSNYDIRTDKEAFSGISDINKELLHSYVIQKIVRLAPNKNRWLKECFNSDITKRNLFKVKSDSSQVSMIWQQIYERTSVKHLFDDYFASNKEGAQLWVDAISASNNIGSKLNIAFMAVTDTLLREELVTSALHDLQHNNYKNSEDLWKMFLWCLGSCTMDYQLKLYNEADDKFKKRYDNWANLMFAGKPSKPEFFSDIEVLSREEPILLNEQLDELTSVIEKLRQR